MGTAEFATACPFGPLKISVGVPLTPIWRPVLCSELTWLVRLESLRSDCHCGEVQTR